MSGIPGSCSIGGCNGLHKAKGYCGKHYARLLVHGDPSIVLPPGVRTQYSKMREYRIWKAMKTRCYNENIPSAKDYSGRGITVCRRWLKSFPDFLSDMGNCPSNKHSIDRIDNNDGYKPSNCRWATKLEQANNQRGNHPVIIGGRTMNVRQWCRELSMPYGAVMSRIHKLGWLDRAALTTPIDKRYRG